MNEIEKQEILKEMKKLLALYEEGCKRNKIIIIVGIIGILFITYSFVSFIILKHYITTVFEGICLISTTISTNKIFNIHIKEKEDIKSIKDYIDFIDSYFIL